MRMDTNLLLAAIQAPHQHWQHDQGARFETLTRADAVKVCELVVNCWLLLCSCLFSFIYLLAVQWADILKIKAYLNEEHDGRPWFFCPLRRSEHIADEQSLPSAVLLMASGLTTFYWN